MAEEGLWTELFNPQSKKATMLLKKTDNDGNLHVTITCHGTVWTKDAVKKYEGEEKYIDTTKCFKKEDNITLAIQYYIEDGYRLPVDKAKHAWSELCRRLGNPDYLEDHKVGGLVTGVQDYDIHLDYEDRWFNVGFYFNPKDIPTRDPVKANAIEADITWFEICKCLGKEDPSEGFYLSEFLEMFGKRMKGVDDRLTLLLEDAFKNLNGKKVIVHCLHCREWGDESSTEMAQMPSKTKTPADDVKTPADDVKTPADDFMPSDDPAWGAALDKQMEATDGKKTTKSKGKKKSFTGFDASKQREGDQTNMSQGGQLGTLANSMYDSIDRFVDYAEEQESIIEEQNSRIAALEREVRSLQLQGSSPTTVSSSRRSRRRRYRRENPSPPMGDYKEIWS